MLNQIKVGLYFYIIIFRTSIRNNPPSVYFFIFYWQAKLKFILSEYFVSLKSKIYFFFAFIEIFSNLNLINCFKYEK